jgi:hypothetical protein
VTPQRLVQLLDRRKPDGTAYYPREDVLHFLPLLLLIVAPDQISNLPPHFHNLMLDFSGKLGLAAGANAEAFQRAIDAYYKQHPVNPTLLADFRDVVKLDASDGRDKLDTARAATALHGFAKERHVPIPQRGSLWGEEGDEKKE